MKLEFLDNLSASGNFQAVVTNQLVRLFDFDPLEAARLRQLIRQVVVENTQPLDVSTSGFVEPVNCNLVLTLANSNRGITTTDNRNFTCALTVEGYQNMVHLLEPFCAAETTGYQWLYDVDTPIDFLFSPGGGW